MIVTNNEAPIQTYNYDLGPRLYSEGTKEIHDHLVLEKKEEGIVGEVTASDAVLVAMVTGSNAALIGEPGGGKTVLSSDSYRIIGGIDPRNVAAVPHTADLTAERLIGSTAATVKTVNANGVERREETKSVLSPLLHPDTQVIWLDEINRVSPFAVNGVLGALGNGRVTTDAGVLVLNGLRWSISTMNPHNKSQSTFRLDPAVVSRHALGVIMGNEEVPGSDDDEDLIIDSIIMDNWEPTPEKIKPVMSLRELDAVREQVKGTRIAENHRKLARHYMHNMLNTWRDAGVAEAKGRPAIHFSRVARGLGVLRNPMPRVEAQDLRDAALLVSCARLAMGARLEYGELRSALNDIVE
ncbi:MAG TPA: AAA family ATPase [Candidatus Saccharimonadales bacterium]|nr:AAA family ATPase [Candidatus Saccharimonadales bacterium]